MSARQRDASGRFVSRGHAIYETRSDGYCRWRVYDPDTGREQYVYVHQLLACLDNDPADVFDPANEVHHVDEIQWHNRRENIEVREQPDHANWHLNGVNFP